MPNGFDNDTVFFLKADTRGVSPVVNQMTDGKVLIGRTVADANGSHITASTLTAGNNVTVTNGPGTISIASTDLHVAKWIVNPVANAGGNQTTIQAAINAAVAGEDIFVMPGTYTENLTLKPGVNITSFPCDGYRDLAGATNNVTIVGKMTMTTAGTVCISNVALQTNSDNILTVTGTAASLVYLNNCFLNCTNATGLLLTSSASDVRLIHCGGSLGTTGIRFFDLSGGGNLEIDGGLYINPGVSVTASTWSAGVLTISNCAFGHMLSTTGSAALGANIYNSLFSTGANVTVLTHGNSSGQQISMWECQMFSGTASTIDVSNAAASLFLAGCQIDSSNTNAVTGVGSIELGPNVFTNSSSEINTTTQTYDYTQLGKYRAQGQPAFSAFQPSSEADETGDGTNFILGDTDVSVSLTEVFDQGANFNPGSASGATFTAPVTGKYQFNAVVLLQQVAATNTATLTINTSNRTYRYGNFGTAVTGNMPLTLSVLADMDANDTCVVSCDAGGGGKTVDVFGGASDYRTGFSGYLVA